MERGVEGLYLKLRVYLRILVRIIISVSCTESKQKTWAVIKQQWVLGSGGMQYNVYAFGGHPILSAPRQTLSRIETPARWRCPRAEI